jgi:cytosine/adenosine deaminase-related metal-dependent hydrolase
MRKFSAHYIFTGTGALLNKGIVVTTDQGVITEVIDTKGDFQERSSVEFYSGIIIPGFVNANLNTDHLSSMLNLSGSVHPKFTILDDVNASLTSALFNDSHYELHENNKICIGLKSKTSHDQQAMLKLIKELLITFPMISLSQIVSWATRNSADALSIADQYGTIEIGKQPGLNLLSGLNMELFTITSNTTLKKLV